MTAIKRVLTIKPMSISEAAAMFEISPMEEISPKPVVVKVVML